MVKKARKLLLYPVEIEPMEEGGFFAYCSSLQGCHAEGQTYAQALENIEAVIKAHLEIRKEHNEAVSNVSFRDGAKLIVNLPILIQS
jgi:predicted RNase H-like HicB family nuclease